MKIYPEELIAAQLYEAAHLQDYPKLQDQQIQLIKTEAQKLLGDFRRHPWLHNALTILLLGGLLAVDLWVLTGLPRLALGTDPNIFRWMAVFFGTSLLHGYLVYSFLNFTLHEGAGHRLLIVGSGRLAQRSNRIAWNLCRLYGGDPVHYRATHISHHAHFATSQDGDFTNFVLPSRFLRSLLPFAGALPFNDFRTHTEIPSKTASHRRSQRVSLLVLLLSLGIVVPQQGWIFALGVLLFIGPWMAFVLDRLRDSTEHNLLPQDTWNGTRNLGHGVWGWVIGGGPWGQPCHLSHHLAPGLPWYQQWRLHRTLRKILEPSQKAHFLMDSSRGAYLRLLMRCWTQGKIFEAQAQRGALGKIDSA